MQPLSRTAWRSAPRPPRKGARCVALLPPCSARLRRCAGCSLRLSGSAQRRRCRQQAGASTWGPQRCSARCPPRTARRLRRGRATGAPAPCPASPGRIALRVARGAAAPRRYHGYTSPRKACGRGQARALRKRASRGLAGPCRRGVARRRPGSPSRAPAPVGAHLVARRPRRASPALLAFLGRLRARLRRACLAAFAAPKRPQPTAAPEGSPHPPPAPQGAGAQGGPRLAFLFRS